MDTKGYYKSLGVKEDASDEEIRKAYRKASLKYHPDKQVGKSDAEKKKAEDKFKEINEAYSTLSDPEKKSNYDKFGDPSARPDIGGFNFGANPFGGFGDIFGDIFGGRHHQANNQVYPGEDISMQVPLTINDIFNGCTKKLKYKRKVRCANCHGEGGSGKTPCTACGGTGQEYRTIRTGFGQMSQVTTCSKCGGSGFTMKSKCPTCGGTGFKEEEHIVEIEFPAGMPNGYSIQKPNEGNESKDKRGANGNFLATARYNIDKKYEINGLDVIEKVYIPYYELLLGTEYTVEIPNGSKKKINIPSCIEDGKLLRLYREGIKGTNNNYVGDYYIEVHYEFPKEISENERKHLESIKVINYNNEKL